MWLQRDITLEPRSRGFPLVTREVTGALPEIGDLRVGLCHLFIRHTSASLTLNENASADVRRDFATWFDDAVPEDFGGWTHTVEGPDDMPAHIRAALTQTHLSIPIEGSRLALGAWQGIYLFEHRGSPHQRTLVLHLLGAA